MSIEADAAEWESARVVLNDIVPVIEPGPLAASWGYAA